MCMYSFDVYLFHSLSLINLKFFAILFFIIIFSFLYFLFTNSCCLYIFCLNIICFHAAFMYLYYYYLHPCHIGSEMSPFQIKWHKLYARFLFFYVKVIIIKHTKYLVVFLYLKFVSFLYILLFGRFYLWIVITLDKQQYNDIIRNWLCNSEGTLFVCTRYRMLCRKLTDVKRGKFESIQYQ